jgi:hypothetical protein
MEFQLLPVPYHGAASYGTICVWRFDQETWVSLDTAAQMVITRNSYMIAKSSEIVDALPTFQQLLQAIRPYPQMWCSFAPMSLSHLRYLALNTPFFDGAGSSTPTFTSPYVWKFCLQVPELRADTLLIPFSPATPVSQQQPNKLTIISCHRFDGRVE